MFKLMNGNKAIASNEVAFELLTDATNFHEKHSHAAQLTWCGTDANFYLEVAEVEPTKELHQNTWIIADGDYFAPVDEDATLNEINNALKEIHSPLTIIEA